MTIEEQKESFIAYETHTCSFPGCNKSILPGTRWKYAWRRFTDRYGNKGEELCKVHAYHFLKEKPNE